MNDSNKTPQELEDEFNKAMLAEVDPVCMKQTTGVTMTEQTHEEECEVATSPPRPKVRRVRLDKERELDKKVDKLPMIGGEYGMYACDKVAARKLFETRGKDKPRWAVYALVVLRDEGRCQVCHEEFEYGKSTVVMRKPPLEGGKFDEYNCITICGECAKVWSKYKNFYFQSTEEHGMWNQYLWVLKRRAFGRSGKGGVGILSTKGVERYRQVLGKVEDMKVQDDVRQEHKVQKVASVFIAKHGRAMSEQEQWEMIKSLGKALDTKNSEPEPDVSIDEDGTVWRTVKE